MDLRQFERIEQQPSRISTAPVTGAVSKMPVDGGPIGAPGRKWLIGWVALFWLAIVLSVIPVVPIYRLIGPDNWVARGFPGTEEWLRSSLLLLVRWGITSTCIAAVKALFLGAALWLMLRSRIRGAVWLPLLVVLGTGIGTAVGYGFSLVLAFAEGGSLFRSDLSLFVLRQVVVVDLVAGVGAAVAMAWVLHRVPGYGWWAGAWTLAYVIDGVVPQIAIQAGAGSSVIGIVTVLIAVPSFAWITGVATFLVLRRLEPEDRAPADAIAAASPGQTA